MANTRDMTPVTVNLDRARPYPIGDDERTVAWVGPGEAEVPKWVADEWAKPRPAPAPISPYDFKQKTSLRDAFANASDEEILAVPGLGEKGLEGIRAWAGGEEAQHTEAEQPPVTIETVEEKPLETVETVEVVPADEVPATGAPKGKRK